MRRLGFFLLLPVLLFAGRAAAQQTSGPEARIETSLGTITIALDRAHAPATVDNFIRYAKGGHFDGTVVYRVVPGFVIQAGSIEADGKERGAHKPIALESGNGLSNLRGSVAMARSDKPASATAEFFIDLADNSRLDAKPGAAPNTTGYAVFGHVTQGMDVVDKIAATPLAGGKGPFPDAAPATPVVIQKVTVSEVAAATVVHLACTHVAGGTWWNPAFVTIDGDAQEVTAANSPDAQPYAAPADIAITDATIHWSWMRGFIDFDRKSGHLDWDMTSEYDYLDTIGQTPDDKRENYKGSMQCTTVGDGKPKP